MDCAGLPFTRQVSHSFGSESSQVPFYVLFAFFAVDRKLALVKKYRDQEIDLADACVVRMSELYEDSVVYTVDRKDFIVYRRHGRQPVRCIFPD